MPRLAFRPAFETPTDQAQEIGNNDLSRPRLYLPAIGVIVLALGLFAYFVKTVWPFTVDDAFITFRYSRNLAMGHGPTYNCVGAPIEGYTTFLWMILMTIPHWMGIDVVVFAKVTGILAILAVMALMFVHVAGQDNGLPARDRQSVAALSVLTLASFEPTAIHAISGMETGLFALLLTGFLVASVRFLEAPSARGAAIFGFTGLLAGLTRPEGNLVVVVTVLTAIACADGKARGVLAGRLAGWYVIPILAYFGWRYAYYHHPFPLSFYVKVSHQQLLAGAMNVLEFAVMFLAFLTVPLLLGLLVDLKRRLPAYAGAGAFVIFFLFPAHIMGFAMRYLFPVVPFVLISMGTGLGLLWELMNQMTVWPRIRSLVRWAVPVTAAACFSIAQSNNIQARLVYAAGLARAHVALGKALGRVPHGPATPVLAIFDAGAVPYYSGWRTIDTDGLNESHIALSGDHSVAYLMRRHPDVVVLVSGDKKSFNTLNFNKFESGYYQECVRRGMVCVKQYTFAPDEYYLWVMTDPKSATAAYFRGH